MRPDERIAAAKDVLAKFAEAEARDLMSAHISPAIKALIELVGDLRERCEVLEDALKSARLGER